MHRKFNKYTDITLMNNKGVGLPVLTTSKAEGLLFNL